MQYPEYDPQYDIVFPLVGWMRMVKLVREVATDVLCSVSPADRDWTPELYLATYHNAVNARPGRSKVRLPLAYASGVAELLTRSVDEIQAKGTITKSLARSLCDQLSVFPREIGDMSLAEDDIWTRLSILSRL